MGMAENRNIIVADESALHVYLHSKGLVELGAKATRGNPLENRASTSKELGDFNSEHPLFGGTPVSLLVQSQSNKRHSNRIATRASTHSFPSGSFLKLKSGLYITSPELTLVRMSAFVSKTQLVDICTNLCGCYYVRRPDDKIVKRPRFLTSLKQIESYIESAGTLNGASKVRAALKRSITYYVEEIGRAHV